jgi:hypothetical protein
VAHQAISDLSGAAFVTELTEAYPEAMVIMNAGDVDFWRSSLSESLAFYVNGLYWFEYSNKGAFWMRRYCSTNFQPIFNHNLEKNGKPVYSEHTKYVLQSIPKERLLETTLGEGWGTSVQVFGKTGSGGTFSIRQHFARDN